MINYHQIFELLLKMLFVYDKYEEDPNKTSVLSADTEWLFRELGTVYGVGDIYQKLM